MIVMGFTEAFSLSFALFKNNLKPFEEFILDVLFEVYFRFVIINSSLIISISIFVALCMLHFYLDLMCRLTYLIR